MLMMMMMATTGGNVDAGLHLRSMSSQWMQEKSSIIIVVLIIIIIISMINRLQWTVVDMVMMIIMMILRRMRLYLRQSIVINVNFTDIAIIRCGKVGVDRSPLNGSKKSLHPQSAH